MKSKGGSLYEVLKSASRPGGADEAPAPSAEPTAPAPTDGAQPTLQERLAAYKAAKLAAATTPSASVAVEPPSVKTSATATVVLEPDPTPVPAPARVAAAPAMSSVVSAAPEAAETEETPLPTASKGPGERVLRLTYNTALFAGMVAVGLLFVAYAVGLHIGKGKAIAEMQGAEIARPTVRLAAPVASVVPPAPPAPVAPPPVRKEYRIRLGEWKFVTSQDRVKALALADDPDLKKALERAGHRDLDKARILRGAEERLALYVGHFADYNSDAAKAALTAMKNFKFKSQTPFAQAAFEEAAPR